MTPTPVPRPTRTLGLLSDSLARPVTGRHLLAGGLLLSLAAAAPLLHTTPRDTDLRPVHVVADGRAAPSPAPSLPTRVLPAGQLVRTTAARASRGGARTALPPTRFELRTVPVGRPFTGLASWYGGRFQGRLTANGERFDTQDLTAASRTLPFGTRLRVCRARRCVVVRINDRGPYVSDRVLDLSSAARAGLGFSGVAQVTATPVDLRRVPVRRALPARRPGAAHRPLPRPTPVATAVPSSPAVTLAAAPAAAVGGHADQLGLALVGASGAGLAWARRRRS